ncbi:MAG: sigma-70 family RNA polymerase sigma factor [Armatimonadetes bacterium]|nr:sigma-70 family RNA polymerase sigma factor [Armatimonadota bacterium]NIM22940.1 sigma-70 family RNA polymerase sigma factor [Armatimonadota bacterium]NIM66811.1 sigma-70 family RNA polymerase sigma factor [Armatimonadota bacterium]NIM75352.1 sigma-70 family RNA polymerase sigma factor [Armatimonadota bacterium]NIN04999.1 sigma-70 family RNA polymerase sigma factor [Armatimonadota bacterium]
MADVEARLDEAALIIRCCEGDAGAFDLLVGAHASRVFNLAYRMLGSQQDAEDAAQEAFLRAFSALKKFRQGAKFSTWIHRITVNVCLDELKRRRSRPQPLTSLYGEREGNPSNPAELSAANPAATDPAEIVTRQAEQQEVQRALASLPPHQRAVVAMCDIEGLTYEEAAAALNVGVGTIKSRLHRAREKLRQLLVPTGN